MSDEAFLFQVFVIFIINLSDYPFTKLIIFIYPNIIFSSFQGFFVESNRKPLANQDVKRKNISSK